MKRPLLLLLILSLTTIASSNTLPPATLHIELAKDTLAMAELTYLTATVKNNMNRDLLLDNHLMFRLHQAPFRFSLFLISPEGDEWAYVGPRNRIWITYIPTPSLWLVVPSGKRVSKGTIIAWSAFLLPEYRVALQKLPSGMYKLFATYELPEQRGSYGETIYSDTVEFVFLPPRWEHMQALIEMDSLAEFYMAGGARFEVEPTLRRIMDTQTPYSEAAHAIITFMAGTCTLNPDSLAAEKALFDELYPGSQFEFEILTEQRLFLMGRRRFNEADSIDKILSRMQPNDSEVLLRQGIIRYPSSLKDLR